MLNHFDPVSLSHSLLTVLSFVSEWSDKHATLPRTVGSVS